MHIKIIVTFIGALALTGCLSPDGERRTASDGSSTSTATTNTLTRPSGAMAARIIFKTGSNGSFDAASSGGSASSSSSGYTIRVGQKAVRIFDPNSASAADALSTWPTWISSVSVGISGASNSGSLIPECSKFADSSEASAMTCNFGTALAPFAAKCGAPSGYYRVSEFDCTNDADLTMNVANKNGNDGVFIRTVFDRSTSKLGSQENVMAVLEYAASVIHPSPNQPSNCFEGGFDPTNRECSDISWQVFLKTNVWDTLQPFLTLVPPAFAYLDTTANTGGSGRATRQIYLPLASDSGLTVFEITRINGLLHGDLTTNCGINSPLCSGMIFYSLTFYRM